MGSCDSWLVSLKVDYQGHSSVLSNEHLTAYINRVAKTIGMSIAFYIHSVRSAFASALIGGMMISRAAYQVCLDRNIDLGGLIKASHEDTIIDEILSYIFAGMGFTFQLILGFRLPFPFNLMLWPFEIGEFAVRWLVVSTAIPK
jgi:hypothetical protein